MSYWTKIAIGVLYGLGTFPQHDLENNHGKFGSNLHTKYWESCNK